MLRSQLSGFTGGLLAVLLVGATVTSQATAIASGKETTLQLKDLRAEKPEAPPDLLIGYTEFRTDLPGGRYVNQATFRAVVVKADGTGRRVLAEELTHEKNYWTQFSGWSPDGMIAIFSRAWMSDENGKWEEEHKTFRYSKDGYLCDGYLFDLANGKATNVTAVERVSHANEYLQFWRGDETKLSFSALIDGVSRPFLMDRDGKNRRELIRKTGNLVHGMSISPDGKRGTYETPNYQLYIADADGSNAKQVKTGLGFHLMPSWSPDGSWVLFVAGEHYDCHPHVVKADGTGLKKLASRNGYRGVIDYLDGYDFHGGSSDLPVWARDSKSIFYTAKVGSNVELFRITLDGKPEQLTDTPAGAMHYHPNPSPDGKWLLFGSKRDGVRQLYVMRLSDKKEWRITDLKKGRAAMWASWQPRAPASKGGMPLEGQWKGKSFESAVVEFRVLPAVGAARPGEKPQAAAPAEQLRALLAEHEAARNLEDYKALCEAYENADDRDRRKTLKERIDKARETFRQQTEKCAAGCLKLAQKFTDDPAALDALFWVVGHTATGAPALPENAALVRARGRALDLLLRDHLRSERLGAFCRLRGMGIMQDPESVKFLEEVLDKSPHRAVQARALERLADYKLSYASAWLAPLRKDPAVAQRFERRWGKDLLKKMLEADPDAMRREGERLYERLAKEYLDVP